MKKVFTDQLSRVVTINYPPKRIISLVPSQTELLFDLVLDEAIIGITKFCTYPVNKTKDVVKVGGTKKLDIDLIKSLKPDLVIGNKEENEQSQIENLMRYFPVWMSDINDLYSALQMITQVGEVVNRQQQALVMAQQIALDFNTLTKAQVPIKVAYLIWQKPYMVAAKSTFINDMLQRCGYVNAFDKERYPEVTIDKLRLTTPDIIMLSSEPYPFKEAHAQNIRKEFPKSKVILVNGEMFSWYGSRLKTAPAYFEELITSLM